MKRTKQEQIDYFKLLAWQFEMDAHRESNDRNKCFLLGKSNAYQIAAFELEHNMEG